MMQIFGAGFRIKDEFSDINRRELAQLSHPVI
jgi:hypothetical protein